MAGGRLGLVLMVQGRIWVRGGLGSLITEQNGNITSRGDGQAYWIHYPNAYKRDTKDRVWSMAIPKF
ncbi:hypothetical protein VNO77_39313 [Canavalia gladiata]|uniref:Uncharacterized protein n=1 Tax=Canavalia gladiata TaxID=3824 RepID=A0AAN9PZN3_CANGL